MSTRGRCSVTRREVLWGTTALAITACPKSASPDGGARFIDPQPIDHATRIAFSPEGVASSDALFPQAVAAGAMRQDSVLLWTRAVGAASITLRVWRDVGSATEVALVTERAISVPPDGNVKVAVDALAPATWYRYAFFSSDVGNRSLIGKVRTALPDDWEEPLTIGATSCAKAAMAPFRALSLMAKQPIDLWLHLGDLSYNDGAATLDEYRAKYRAQLADAGYRDAFAAAGAYLVWDDHEFLNNFDPEAMGPNDAQTLAAKQAYFETLPVERGANDRLWRSYRWGKTAEIFLLDCRSERRLSTRETPQATYLSREQMDWVKQAVVDSPCHFKVLMNSVPITTLPPPLWGGQSDRWQGYQAAREELLGHLETNDVRNVWFVTGDVHLGLVMRLDRSGPHRRFFEIAAGPAAQSNPLAIVLESGTQADRDLAFPPDQFVFAVGGYLTTMLTFDPKSDSVRVVILEGNSGATKCDRVVTFGG